MGVSTNCYTIIGVRLEMNDAFVEAWDDVYSDDDTPNVIVDCMSGEYLILGEILFDSGDYRWGFEDGDTYKEHSHTKLIEKEQAYKTAFISKFPEFKDLVKEPFKVISVVHYS